MLIPAIHASGHQLVIALTGGGSEAISRLLTVPGASRTVLEALVPYSSAALTKLLGSEPEQYCSSRTARAMAMVAFERSREWVVWDADAATPADRLIGVGCTAALATDRPKAGPHRAHIAIQSANATVAVELDLEKGARSRTEEESLVADLILREIATACGASETPELKLSAGDKYHHHVTSAKPSWREVLLGEYDAVAEGVQQHLPSPLTSHPLPLLFPGAFNPLHDGHRQMAAKAAEHFGRPVEWEISLLNVDKPPLDYREIESRLAQFAPEERVWLTRAPTFIKKAELFPGATFIVGADTIARIADPKYYGGDAERAKLAIEQLAVLGVRFLAFGRLLKGAFRSASDLTLPAGLLALCEEVSAGEFRMDLSSTELRREG